MFCINITVSEYEEEIHSSKISEGITISKLTSYCEQFLIWVRLSLDTCAFAHLIGFIVWCNDDSSESHFSVSQKEFPNWRECMEVVADDETLCRIWCSVFLFTLHLFHRCEVQLSGLEELVCENSHRGNLPLIGIDAALHRLNYDSHRGKPAEDN